MTTATDTRAAAPRTPHEAFRKMVRGVLDETLGVRLGPIVEVLDEYAKIRALARTQLSDKSVGHALRAAMRGGLFADEFTDTPEPAR